MNKQKLKLTIGSLLHDIGKATYRGGDGRNHSSSGYDFVKNDCKITDSDILDCIKYHHIGDLKQADLDADNLAYITYFADNIAAFADRREDKTQTKDGFERYMPLASVFNNLNKNNRNGHYEAKYLNHDEGINYPTEEDISFDKSYYTRTLEALKDKISNLEINKSYLQSLIEVLEAYLTFVPSSTSTKQIGDISLYEHQKLTVAIAATTYDYLEEKGLNDYTVLLEESNKYYDEEMFLLCSLDVSGIQNFIYTIVNSKALKSLRTRSFYLEILLEIIIDDILEELNLSRANLLYSGGGHAYLLLANTKGTEDKVESYIYKLNNWFLEYFQTDLYLAYGLATASANNFRNQPQGSYEDMFRSASRATSDKKLHRYDLDQLAKLNFEEEDLSERECKICKRPDMLEETEDGQICKVCQSIENFSRRILDYDFFAVEENTDQNKEYTLPLPFGRVLLARTKDELTGSMTEDHYKRAYTKNDFYTGKDLSTKLWVGDYSYDKELKNLAQETGGIKRLAVLRADVDNLGQAFVAGFDKDIASLTRSAVFSHNMNIFFKYHINYILENPCYSLDSSKPQRRRLLIVYSGGDDVFLVGGWKDVIEAAIDINQSLEKFTLGSLTISAGLGIYQETYPIKAMAQETGDLEEAAKANKYVQNSIEYEKNSICIFEEDLVFSWGEFKNKVLEEKYQLVANYMKELDDRGKSFIYNIVNLLRSVKDERLNIARLAYLLARLEPKNKAKSDLHKEFSQKLYRYANNKEDRKQLIAAIYIYIYMER